MRHFCFFICLLTALGASAQEKGVKPLQSQANAKKGAVYALIVGISDYEDPGIPKLKYAHRDAEAFAEFLRSPAGGSLDKDHLQVLLNEQATLANVVIAGFGTLQEQVKEGDLAIIYFSGHGDVDKKLFNKPGYLLCRNASAASYMAGGCFNVRDLQEIVTTLTEGNKAKVLLITDACHSGKLAGDAIGGRAITGASLAAQFSSETKILSCQSNEVSLEGTQWGGGRGIFSYHLVDGLTGLADEDADGFVTLKELGRYLEDHVSGEVETQNPVLIGNKAERLAAVNAEELAKLRRLREGTKSVLAAVDSRGIEDQVLATVDTATRRQYYTFKSALEKRQFFQPENACAEDLYAVLSADARLEPLHGFIKRNYAAALCDEAQTAINDYLSSDPVELRKRWGFDNRYDNFPQYLHRAAELLGPKHLFFHNLKALEYYFGGLNLRLRGEREKNKTYYTQAADLQQQALQQDSGAAYAHNELGLLARRLRKYPESINHFKQAAAYSPAWALPWANLSASYLNLDDYPGAEQAAKEAIVRDTDFALAHYNLGLAFFYRSDLGNAKTSLQKTLALDPDYADAYDKLGLVAAIELDYAQAEKMWVEYNRRRPGEATCLVNLGEVSLKLKKKQEALQWYQEALRVAPNDYSAHLKTGEFYLLEAMYEKAGASFRRCLEIEAKDPGAYYFLAALGALQDRPEEARTQLEQAVSLDDNFTALHDQRLENLLAEPRFVALLDQHFPKWKGN